MEAQAAAGKARRPLVKQTSEGTLKLNSLRRRLEELEAKKADMLIQEENERRRLREIVNQRYHALKQSIDESLDELHQGLAKLDEKSSELQLVSQNENPNIQSYSEELGQPSSGRDAALALAWLERGCVDNTFSKETAKKKIREECAFLERQTLAAKVTANVSLQQKKLLNLTYSWLRTFLPHCLGKINRVSFGLLTEEDCEKVLNDDPMVPRSRLKLAVPFVGKDVPSTSSEFAHPDIIIGLTVLAYRYSGLRRSDFNDIIDSLTADFTREIGPARDRPSSRKHELWVLEAGGRLRGIKSSSDSQKYHSFKKDMVLNDFITSTNSSESEEKDDYDQDYREVVQLKFLSKSNAEQMDKLFELWSTEPHVIHHYLGRFIFPAYMRHQRSKISASGQSVGGDMLFGRRVGFSGTPSDLLPKELGKCSYETGDDGKMLTTVLDKDVTSYEHLPADWSVEGLLDMIATSTTPRYHALIDTGALITGYSNQQVAEELLKRGLGEWCDGVVFLDENDTKKVLVKDTGRVVPADQCGVPLERRFAFYDQIHTTGMDIQHVVNAVAALTLGKDMVFRDFVQGAYRMRGIGVGQTVRVFIIPEVKNLIERELKAVGENPILLSPGDDPVLTEIVAWLVINSMRSEMTQWSMLCLQNVTNVFRKNAFRQVLAEGLREAQAIIGTVKEHDTSYITSDTITPVRSVQYRSALEVFDEPIDFTLDSTVPDPMPFSQKLQEQLDNHADFIETPEQRTVAEEVLVEVRTYSVTDGRTMERLDSEQEREQEQEQEKEIRSKREQEIEVEKFVDREYTRSDEAQRSWHASILMQPPQTCKDNDGFVDRGHPFFPLNEFKLRYGEPLKFPDYLGASRNYFNPSWTGLRRLKNVIMVLEYAPEPANIVPKSAESTLRLAVLDEPNSIQAFQKAFTLLANNSASLDHGQLQSAIRAATDVLLDDDETRALLAEFGDGQRVDCDGLRRILTSGRVRVIEDGRYFIAISLAEAETLRRIIHMQKDGESLLQTSSGSEKVKASNVQIALRYIPLQTLSAGQHEKPQMLTMQDISKQCGLVFDASRGWRDGTEPRTGVSSYQRLASHACFRFLDCAQHYTEHALNTLVRSLQRDHVHTRELFFQNTIGARRRLERKWQETPLSKVFTISNEWALLKLHAQAVFIRKALAARSMTLWEAFTAFDFDDNGALTPAEFYGAMRFLKLPDLTAVDIVDMIEAADRNGDGVLDYREYLDMLKEGGALVEGDLEDDHNNGNVENEAEEHGALRPRQVTAPKVEPYGADMLREIIVTRRRESTIRQRKDRARRQAYQQALDIKVFEAELRASLDRKGGSNPTVNIGPEKRTTIFWFSWNDAPIRMVSSGKWQFSALRNYNLANKKPEVLCSEGHVLESDSRYWENCVICTRRHIRYRCDICSVYQICIQCYMRSLEVLRRKSEDLSDKLTFAQIFGGCSFSLQVPSAALRVETVEDDDAIIAAVTTNPSSSDIVTQEEIEQEELKDPTVKDDMNEPPPLFEVKSERFSVTMEVRFERLPPKGQCAALLRFFPSTYGRSRSRHLASVYLTHSGRVVSYAKINEGEIELEEPSNLIKPNIWYTVTIVVDAEIGTLATYVNGELSSISEGLDSESLTLRHQLVVFGGGKQAQARGGHITRLLIHDTPLTTEEVKHVAFQSKNYLTTHIVWYVAPGTTVDAVAKELDSAGYHLDICESIPQALAALKPYTKCFIVTLNDSPTSYSIWDDIVESEEEDIETPKVPKPEEIIMSVDTLFQMVRAANSSIVCVSDGGNLTYRAGDRVSCRYRQGNRWSDGRISRAYDDKTFDIIYDNGSTEERVRTSLIKPIGTAVPQLQHLLRDKSKVLDMIPAVNQNELREAVFASEVEFLRRSSAVYKFQDNLAQSES